MTALDCVIERLIVFGEGRRVGRGGLREDPHPWPLSQGARGIRSCEGGGLVCGGEPG